MAEAEDVKKGDKASNVLNEESAAISDKKVDTENSQIENKPSADLEIVEKQSVRGENQEKKSESNSRGSKAPSITMNPITSINGNVTTVTTVVPVATLITTA